MSFVPGHPHDLFLSYAHGETAWVDTFRDMLSQQLYVSLGRKVEFWRDKDNLRVGEDWAEKIEGAIRATAAFMAVCSPIYFESKECLKETAKAASFQPKDLFLKIVKTPHFTGKHEKFYPNLHRIDFFSEKGDFPLGSKEFEAKVIDAAKGIGQGLLKLRNSKVGVFMAECAPDMTADRATLIQQLEADGFNVRTADPAFGDEGLAEEIGEERVAVAVFLLGGQWHEYIGHQIAAAVDAGKRAVVWIHPVRSAKPERQQDDLIQAIKSGERIPPKSEVLGSSTVRIFAGELQGFLRPEPEFPTLAATAGTQCKVGLIHDPGETSVARKIEGMIRDRKYDVFLPDPGEPGGILRSLPRMMAAVNGLLLYRGPAPQPDNWLNLSVPEVYKADSMDKAKSRVRNLVLANPSPYDQWLPGDVIACAGEPSPEILKPFFDRMEQARAANGCA